MRSRALVFLALIGAVGVGLVAWPRQTRIPNPIEARFELVLGEIYDAARWVRRLPVDLALPVLARSKIRGFLSDLDLEPDAKARVLQRLDSEAFVDEVVPFALALRDVYMVSDEWQPETFDAWLRRSYRRDEQIPGFEHSMFSWQPEDHAEEREETSGPGFDDELTALLVELYDALYLRDQATDESLSDQLACARRDTEAARAPAARRVLPVVRELLVEVRRRFSAESEIGSAIGGILDDADRLEAVAISLVHFIDDFVCSHYRIFATRVLREQQLDGWMRGELGKPGGGQLWSYLEWAQKQRRHGVLVVVDGLQGHLVEALSTGREGRAFLHRIDGEQRRGASMSLPDGAKRAPEQRTEFLQRVAADGIADDRYLGFFKALYAEPSGIAKVGVSTTPTISVRNLPLAKTGAPVAGDGATSIPNFHFVDREVRPQGRAYYFFGNDALQLAPMAHGAGMRSLFDRLPLSQSFSCGAQYDSGAHYRVDPFINLALGEKMRDFAELRCLGELRRRAAHEKELGGLRAELLAKRPVLSERFGWLKVVSRWIQRDEYKLAERLVRRIAELEAEAMPELTVYYNPWPDHFAHFTGPFADEILAPSGELNRLDYWLGMLSDIYREAGVAPRTLFAMTGDHGLSPVFSMLNPEVAVFEPMRARGTPFRIEKISSDEGEGPKLTNPLNPPSMKGFDAVVASTAGGNYMIDLFVDQEENWSRQPLRSEIERLQPLGGGAPLDLVTEIYRHLADTLDYMVLRAAPCDVSGGEVVAIGRIDGARAEASIVRRGRRIRIEQRGGDLLSLSSTTPYEELDERQIAEYRRLYERCVVAAQGDRPESWCDEDAWRVLTSYTARPDSVVQLAHLYDTDRAGTINLFPRLGIGYNTVVPGRHAGESFHEKDAFVGAWGEPVEREMRPRSLQVGAAPATIYAYLADRAVAAGTDGWGFSSIALTADAVAGSTTD